MKINIEDFPAASYDPSTRLAYLCDYYPYEAVRERNLSEPDWRNSGSGKILDYKEGRENDLAYFIKPVEELIQFVLRSEQKYNPLIIPMPSSIPKTNLDYKTTPRLRGQSRNRDNRNLVFAYLLAAKNTSLKVGEILLRIQEKTPKDRWSAGKHKESMNFNMMLKPLLENSNIIFLLDDVSTSRNTLDGARDLIIENCPNAFIVYLVLGNSTAPI